MCEHACIVAVVIEINGVRSKEAIRKMEGSKEGERRGENGRDDAGLPGIP